jgi:CRISPR-associated protein Csm1
MARGKHQRFNLCATGVPGLGSTFPHGVCDYNGWLPADRSRSEDAPASCALSRDQIEIGTSLLRFDRLLVLQQEHAQELHPGESLAKLERDILGYSVAFTEPEEASGRFGDLARSGALRRCWDFSRADQTAAARPLWAGYARRDISSYAPPVSAEDLAKRTRYEAGELAEEGDLKTLDMIACEDKQELAGEWVGVDALGIIKGDVDNLGEIFRIGVGDLTFAKTASLSRQLNGFFSIYLSWLLAREFCNVYTIFAGGDDFFLIAPWRTAQKLAIKMREEFARYAANNPQVHFSCGIATQRPGAPIAALADLVEDALEASKGHLGKDAITCFGETMPWSNWLKVERAFNSLSTLREGETLSAGYVYRLLQFLEMRAQEKDGKAEAAIWRARFRYATRRYIVDKRGDLRKEEERHAALQLLAREIGDAIEELGAWYRIPLFNLLYQNRRS